MTTARYQPLSASNSMRTRPRLYIWDEHLLDDPRYDIVAMERALNGDPVPLNDAEKYATARILHRQLRHVDDIARRNKLTAERVGVTDRTILRWATAGWPSRDFTTDGAAITGRPKTATPAERLTARTHMDNGHLIWTGPLSRSGQPTFAYGKTNILAGRIAYQQHTGHEPRGIVRSTCGVARCLLGEHLADLPNPCAPTHPKAVAA
ncbi:hypothetical protein PV703_15675 [Streptomyces sp. ME01-24h]|nr:hypothetical protein [Streptomyces sp. ME01-24h]